MTDDNFKELLRTLDRQTRTIEDVKRAVDYGTAAIERVQREVWWLFVAIMVIAATLFASGCAASPMDDWRDDVELSCYAAVDRLEQGCSTPSRVDCAQGMAAADGAGCLGAYERVMACWQRADVSVYCAPWGPDVGSQCDEQEWELRTCIYPELKQ